MTHTNNSLKGKVQVLLNEAEHDIVNDFFNSEITDDTCKYDSEETKDFREELKKVNVKFKHVANHGGEGQGEDFWSVYEFTDGTDKVYIQFDGWYQSYNGSEFNEFFFVTPKEVTVTQYFTD